MPEDHVRPFRAGELARAAGVSKDTLRYYERERLIAPPRRRANGYREYPAATLRRVRVIRAAIAIGFTVRELGEIFQRRDAGDAPCHDVRALAGEKLERLKFEIEELTACRSDLARILRDWDRRLSAMKKGSRAGLLEALADARAARRSENGVGDLSPREEREKSTRGLRARRSALRGRSASK